MAQQQVAHLEVRVLSPNDSFSGPRQFRQPISSVYGDYACVLKGYSSILSLEEMKNEASHHHQVDVPREKKIACCVIFISIVFICILAGIYWVLLFDQHYDLQDSRIISLEGAAIMSTLLIGICCLRWISFNDISPKTIWDRVAVKHASPLKMIKFDMDNVDITYYEYNIDYGQYPHKLHEPIITLIKQEQICNARDLVKIAKKEPEPDEAYSYGAIYFHYKGTDEYLLDRWKYDFGKYHNKVVNVHKKCNKFHYIFSRHFGYKYKYNIIDDNDSNNNKEGVNSKYIPNRRSFHEKQEAVTNILDHITPSSEVKNNNENDIYVMNTHDNDASSSDDVIQTISPVLLGKVPIYKNVMHLRQNTPDMEHQHIPQFVD